MVLVLGMEVHIISRPDTATILPFKARLEEKVEVIRHVDRGKGRQFWVDEPLVPVSNVSMAVAVTKLMPFRRTPGDCGIWSDAGSIKGIR